MILICEIAREQRKPHPGQKPLTDAYTLVLIFSMTNYVSKTAFNLQGQAIVHTDEVIDDCGK